MTQQIEYLTIGYVAVLHVHPCKYLTIGYVAVLQVHGIGGTPLIHKILFNLHTTPYAVLQVVENSFCYDPVSCSGTLVV
jgi:hypothetical protein